MRLAAAVVLVAAGCSSMGCAAGSDAPMAGTARDPAPAAASRDAASLSDRTVHRRAVELTIWGMPAVSMAATRQALKRDLDADFGDVVYFSQVAEPRHEFLTANNQTPYVMTFFDLRRGPMVLDVPPASSTTVFFGSAIDSWEVPVADIGPSGDDAGKGGRYLFLPPGYRDKPPGGYFVVPSETAFVHIALRPISIGKGTLADAVAYSQRLKTYPLADPRRATRYLDAYPKAWKTLPTFDVNDLRLLAESIDVEPPQAKDAAMLAMAASIGIEKGEPFRPDAARTQLLNEAIREGKAAMNEYFMTRAFQPFWPNRQWLALKSDNTFGFSYYGNGMLDYERRAGAFAFWATFAPKKLGDPAKLPASYYLNAFRDSTGALFRGDTLYQIRMPADTPAHDFWSIIAYEVGTNAFIHNPENRVGVSSYDKSRMTLNPDGSVNVYIGPTAPQGLAANWIPTAGKDFWLLGRFYGPDKVLFDKVWTMPDVEKAK